ncbi:MAG: hypothetical protein ACKO9Q_10720 [Pirellula sp.]
MSSNLISICKDAVAQLEKQPLILNSSVDFSELLACMRVFKSNQGTNQ